DLPEITRSGLSDGDANGAQDPGRVNRAGGGKLTDDHFDLTAGVDHDLQGIELSGAGSRHCSVCDYHTAVCGIEIAEHSATGCSRSAVEILHQGSDRQPVTHQQLTLHVPR